MHQTYIIKFVESLLLYHPEKKNVKKPNKEEKKCFNGILTTRTPAKAGIRWSKYTTCISKADQNVTKSKCVKKLSVTHKREKIYPKMGNYV